MSSPNPPLAVSGQNKKPVLSLQALQEVFPGRRAAEEAAAAAVTPAPPTVGVSPGAVSSTGAATTQRAGAASVMAVEEAARRAEEDRRRAQDPGVFSDPAAVRGTAMLGAGAVMAPFTTGASIPVAMGMMGAAGGSTSLVTSLLQGREMSEALEDAAWDAATFAAGEGLGPVVAKGIGAAGRGVFGLIGAARQGIRRARGLKPLVRVRSVKSSSAPFANKLLEDATEVKQTLNDLDLEPLLGQMVNHNAIDTTQKMLERAVTSAQGFRAHREMIYKRLGDEMRAVVAQFPPMPAERVGQLVQHIVDGRLTRLKGVAQGYYAQADRILGQTKTVTREITEQVPTGLLDSSGKPLYNSVTRTISEEVPLHGVDIRPLKKIAAAELKKLEGGIGTNPDLERLLKTIVNDKPDTVTFQSAQQMRTELFAKSKQFDLTGTDVLPFTRAASQHLATSLTGSINAAARRVSPEARDLLQSANRIWGQEIKGELTNAIISRLAKTQPEDVLAGLLAGGRSSDIKIVRNLLLKEPGGKEAWEAIQGSFLNNLMYKHAVKAVKGEKWAFLGYNAKAMIDDMASFAGADGAAMRELFPNAFDKSGIALSNFRKYMGALESTQRGLQGEATGSVLVQFRQAEAIGTVVRNVAGLALAPTGIQLAVGGAPSPGTTAAGIGAAAFYLIAPAAMSRIFRNPELINWLTVGAKHSPLTRQGMKAAITTLGLFLRHNLLSSEEDVERAKKQMVDLQGQLKEAK